MKNHINSILALLFIFPIIFVLSSCLDSDPTENPGETTKFVSGSADGTAYPFAEGMIHAAGETLGFFMDNLATDGSLDNATYLVHGDAYLGLVQEDIFIYAKDKYLAQFKYDQNSAEKKYLKIASQLKVIMAAYDKDVFLLVNTNNIYDVYNDTTGGIGADGKITLNDLLYSTSPLNINIGSEDSDNYITAKTIIDNNTFTNTPFLRTDDPVTGIQNVQNGIYSAAFLVSESPASALLNIPADANVKLIRVYMPDDKKIYREDGRIFPDDYAFQDDPIEKNIKVRTLLATGPFFSDRVVDVFIDYALDHAVEYKSYNHNWESVNYTMTREYMSENPLKCNYNALCHIAGYAPIDPFYLEPYFCSGEGAGAYHDMAVELIWLLSHNLDIDLRERNTTGTWENTYWMLNGNAAMSLVQDDIYNSLIDDDEDLYSIMQAASIQKVAPLHYEYVHLVVNTNGAANWSAWNFNGTNDDPSQLAGDFLEQVFTDPLSADDNAPVLHINVGPKTSGTYISAMKIINSYKSIDSDSDDTSDFEEMNIYYHFDSPSDAVLKVKSGDYHMAFVTTGVPYHRFYSHGTYSLGTNLALIPARFYDADGGGDHLDDAPFPYREGTLAGGGVAAYENYPYPGDILSSDIPTVRVRAMLAASPAINNTYIHKFLKAVYRKTDYKIFPFDPDDPDFTPDPLWMPVVKNSYGVDDPFYDYDAIGTDYGTYSETIIGAKEYFVRDPFGWNDSAAAFYLLLFPDN